MQKAYLSLLRLLVLSAIIIPFFYAYAADYSSDLIPRDGEYVQEFDSMQGIFKQRSKRVELDLEDGRVQLDTNEDGDFYTQGVITSKKIRKHQFDYFESVNFDMNVDTPNGTSVDLYLFMKDPYGPDAPFDPYWHKITPGQEYAIGEFISATHNKKYNKLRWKAVLKSDNPTKTPVIHSLTIHYGNAVPGIQALKLLDNTFGVNNTPGAKLRVTIFGNYFHEGEEEVYLKDMLAADSVTFIDSKTLIAEFPIESLTTGTYTVVVRNTNSGRLGVTYGSPLPDSFASQYEAADVQLILKGFAPEMTSFSPGSISYLNGGTITIRGKNFADGSTVEIGGRELPTNSIVFVDTSTIQVDIISTLTTYGGWPRGENMIVKLIGPDYQTSEMDGFQID